MCCEGKKAKTDTLFKAPNPKNETLFKEKQNYYSMKRKALFLFCYIGCMNESHIDNVAF